MPQATTESVENYLKAIFKLEDGGGVGTGEIAKRLQISSSSVSRMLKRLSKQQWVELSPYRGVRLTEKGRRQALRVIRNHRILETYLAEILVKTGRTKGSRNGRTIGSSIGSHIGCTNR